MRSEIVRFDKIWILPFSVLSLTQHYNLHSTVLFRPGTFGLGDLHYIVMCIRIHRARFQGSTMQVRGWYKYKQPESELPSLKYVKLRARKGKNSSRFRH